MPTTTTATSPPVPTPARSPGRTRLRRLLWLVWIALIALAVRAVLENQDELVGAFDTVKSPIIVWVAIGVVAELMSYFFYSWTQRRLLAAGGRTVGLPFVLSLSLAVQAIGNCLPAGATLSNVVTFRELQRRRVEEGLTLWMIVVVAVLYPAVLAVLAVIGVQIAGGEGAASGIQAASYGLLGVLALAATIAFVLWRRGLLGRALAAVLRLVGRLPGLHSRVRQPAGSWHLGHVQMSAVAWIEVVVALTLAWLTDVACLAAAFAAVGAAVPWSGLLLAYCAGQLAQMLPITPGGLGVVEGSLTLALVAFGGGQESTLAAVLLYRLISFWGVLVVGAGAYLGIRVTATRAPANVLSATTEASA
jgi:hypothetical protein